MPNGDLGKLKVNVEALQRDTASLLKLLGGDADDRLRFWEIFKGITTPADFLLVNHQIEAMHGLVNQVQTSAKVLEHAAKEMRAPARV